MKRSNVETLKRSNVQTFKRSNVQTFNTQNVSDVLVVATGDECQYGTCPTEVIDLNNPNTICDDLDAYPVDVEEATGGVFPGGKFLICGGGNPSTKYCYLVGAAVPFATMNAPRKMAASLVFGTSLWVRDLFTPR